MSEPEESCTTPAASVASAGQGLHALRGACPGLGLGGGHPRAWLDVLQIQDLIIRERYWRDRAEWDLMRSAWTDDAVIHVTWFTGTIDEYVEDSRQPGWDPHAINKHRLSPPLVTVHHDKAIAETSIMLELRLTNADGILFDAHVSCRLLSRVARTSDGWRLASMDAIYEKDIFTPVYPADTLSIAADDTAGYRCSYQFLAYGGNGQLPDDIPGDDRPDLVDALYADATTWLHENS